MSDIDPPPSNPDLPPPPDPNHDNGQFEFARLSPLMPRIHADDEDKKTTCLFWTVLFFALLVIVIVAHFAVPDIYEQHPRGSTTTTDSLCTFPATPVISNGGVYCGNYFSDSKIGEVIFGWSQLNQFALTYLQVIPVNLRTELNFNAQSTFRVYELDKFFNQTIQKTHFLVVRQEAEVNITIEFSSGTADKIYAEDMQTVQGYQLLLASITHLNDKPFFIQMTFSSTLTSSQIAGLYLQSKAVNGQFTVYTIVIRYVFLALSICALILYAIRFLKIPPEKKIIEQKFVFALSILQIMFNDPFYPITILKPNGGSAFFSIVFVINLVATLFLFWLVTADRIHLDDGQLTTEQFTKKKTFVIFILWLEMLIVTMVYSMQQINQTPVLTTQFNRRFLIARVVIIITALLPVLYIGYRYGQICASQTPKLWRSYIFIIFSVIFIIALFIMVAANSFVPYHYEGSAIFLVYGFVNVYIYYIQYMFTITNEQAQKMDNIGKNGGIQEHHDVLSVGTIDVVDVDLEAGSNTSYDKWRRKPLNEKVSVEVESVEQISAVDNQDNSDFPVKNKDSQFHVEFDDDD